MKYHFISSCLLLFGPNPSGSFTISSTLKSPNTNGKLHMSADEGWVESQLEESKVLLSKIETLQETVQGSNSTEDLQSQSKSVELVELDVEKLISKINPPTGLSMKEFEKSIQLFLSLPPVARLAFVKALDMEDNAAGEAQKIPEIVAKLYEERSSLTPKLIADSLKMARQAKGTGQVALETEDTRDAETVLADFLEKDVDEMRLDSNVKQLLGRVTRKDDVGANAKDLEILMSSLDNSIFSPNDRPVEIPGGYLVRGQNRKSSGQELIESLDSKLPSNWDCTVSFMPDISADDPFTSESNALVLLKQDMSTSTSVWVYRFSTLCAMATTLLFSVGIYGENDAVVKQLTDAAAIGDYSGLDFFNGKVAEFLLPLTAILLSHEFGHFLISKKEKIETSSLIPTLLPFWSNLPLLGSLNRITSSPRSFTALFDFASLGPLLGFISSFAFFGIGLLETKNALEGGGGGAEFLPSIPVGVLKLSTLAGSITDSLFGGAGIITAQDLNVPVPLHPFAIAGFCGLLINAAEMLPLGATDGARMSLSLFGRQGQSIAGGLTWLALLVSSFTLTDEQGAVLVTAWIVGSVAQNDMEVPCRDETDTVNLARSLLAFSLWFLAALVIIPMA